MIPFPYQAGGAGLIGESGARRFWRISISANNGDALFTCIQEVAFSLTTGGDDVTSPTTPVVVSTLQPGYPGSKVVDNDVLNDQNVWNSLSGAAFPHTLTLDLGGSYNLVEFSMWAQNNAGTTTRAPQDFLIQSGPTSSGPWTTERTVTGQTGWTAGSRRDFSIP